MLQAKEIGEEDVPLSNKSICIITTQLEMQSEQLSTRNINFLGDFSKCLSTFPRNHFMDDSALGQAVELRKHYQISATMASTT